MKKVKKEIDPEVIALKNQLARTLADYDNLSKRVERERIEIYGSASLQLVKRLLPILDMLDFAQNHLNDAGLAITLKEFRDLLKEEGYIEIKPELESEFDERLQEAVEVVDTEEENKNNTIAEVSITGWQTVSGNVVRPAKVKVYKTK